MYAQECERTWRVDRTRARGLLCLSLACVTLQESYQRWRLTNGEHGYRVDCILYVLLWSLSVLMYTYILVRIRSVRGYAVGCESRQSSVVECVASVGASEWQALHDDLP